MNRTAPVLVVVGLLSACAPELTVLEGSGELGGGEFGSVNPKIFGGSAPTDAHHDAVVALHEVTRRGVYVDPICTGTLIGEDWVLTAAHCVTSSRGAAVSASSLGIYVGDDPSVDLASHFYTVSRVIVHRSYSTRTMYNDIALLELTSPITEVDPIPYLPSALALSRSDIGSPLNFAGFGYDETWSYGEKLQVDQDLGGFGCAVAGCSGAGSSALQISYVQTGGVGPCSGDSGGPAFIERSGDWYVAGITSYGDANCTRYGVSTRVDAFATWINRQTGL